MYALLGSGACGLCPVRESSGTASLAGAAATPTWPHQPRRHAKRFEPRAVVLCICAKAVARLGGFIATPWLVLDLLFLTLDGSLSTVNG